MKKEVMISIAGLQSGTEDPSGLEVISRGEYYFKNGKHFCLFEELSEEDGAITKCTLKISSDAVELTKKGAINVHMLFEREQANMTCYNTPFGDLMLGINTTDIQLEESEEHLHVKLKYALDMNYQKVADCHLTIRIADADKADFIND